MPLMTAPLAAGITLALAAGSGIAFAPAASARDSADDRWTGTCSAGSRWVAELESDDGEIETEFTVKTGTAGQRWTYTLTQNGQVVATSTRTARADDDSLDDDSDEDAPSPRHPAEVEWDRDRPDTRGADTFTMRAVNTVTGETCTASIG